MALHVLETRRPPHLLTVEEFMTLDTASRIELLGGFIYDESPRNEPHRYAVRKLNETLAVGVAGRYIV
jgi:hypothetical protein